jgi:MerR family regulatory protein
LDHCLVPGYAHRGPAFRTDRTPRIRVCFLTSDFPLFPAGTQCQNVDMSTSGHVRTPIRTRHLQVRRLRRTQPSQATSPAPWRAHWRRARAARPTAGQTPLSLRIGALADATGVTVRLMRYYEERGLLRPERTVSGQRVLDGSNVGRVPRFVSSWRQDSDRANSRSAHLL